MPWLAIAKLFNTSIRPVLYNRRFKKATADTDRPFAFDVRLLLSRETQIHKYQDENGRMKEKFRSLFMLPKLAL